MKSMLPTLVRIFLLSVLVIGGHGCMGYKLGTMLPPDIKTVCVPTFVNKTTEPNIEIQATSACIAEFQKDGSLKVADLPNADTVIEVTLPEYALTPLAYDSVQKTATKEYRLVLTAGFVMKRKSDGRLIAENPQVQGENTFFMQGDFTSSKQAALPKAAEDLARQIVQRVVETW